MNKSFVFFLVATIITLLSVAVLNTGPIVSKRLGSNWKTLNCLRLSDQYKEDKDDYEKETDEEEKKEKDIIKKLSKKKRDICQWEKAMYGLEYSAFTLDLTIGFICSLLGLLHYLDEGKDFIPKTGLIGLISGAVAFVVSLVYLIYSILVYTKDTNGTIKLDENTAFAKWDSSENAYICSFYEENDYYFPFAKYNELGKKQYNYNKDLYISKHDPDSVISKCTIESQENIDWEFGCWRINIYQNQIGKHNDCEKIYIRPTTSNSNLDLNNRWLTTIILTVIIILCDACLALFGFLLFKNKEEAGEVKVV